MKKLIMVLALLIAAFGATGGLAEGQPVAIVVHPDVQVSDLTTSQLRRIFLADQQFWPDRSTIVLLVRAPKADDRNMVLDRIYHMSESE